MATAIGTRTIPALSDKDPKRQQFFEEVKFRLDNAAPSPAPGPSQSGASVTGSGVAGRSILAYRVLTTDAVSELTYADSSIAGHGDQILGLSINAASVGQLVQYVEKGDIANPGWNWTRNEPIFLGLGGVPTQNPNTGVFQIQLGYAKSPTVMNVAIGIAIHR